MFAYCANNPINKFDPTGEFWNLAAGAVLGGIISGVTQITTNLALGKDWHSGVGLAIAGGVVGGALSASSIGKVGQIVGNAIISGVSEAITQYAQYKNNPGNFKKDVAVASVIYASFFGGVAGAIGGDGVRAKGSAYANALDNLDTVSTKVASGYYNSASTGAKLVARATGVVCATGRSATISTGIKFAIGAKNAQYGMAAVSWLMQF